MEKFCKGAKTPSGRQRKAWLSWLLFTLRRKRGDEFKKCPEKWRVILDLPEHFPALRRRQGADRHSFDVREHEIRAIIGPNGAGKSASMLNVINGVYHPQEGKIFWHGSERKKMEPHMAAQQNIAAPSRTSRCSRA